MGNLEHQKTTTEMKKYNGVLTLSVEVKFNNPDASDLSEYDIHDAIINRLYNLAERGELFEAVLPVEDFQEEDQ